RGSALMLSIGKLGRGQERYYLDKVAEGAEDYYSGEGEAEGYWLGDAARDLDLEGKVEPAQLVSMLTGEDPATGDPLGLRHVEGGAVPGFDLTFSAPKSVSILWALGGGGIAAEVKAAHAEAVEAALGYLQEVACLTRRGAGGREFLPGNGFLATGYVHRSSRAGDMQIHTHVLVANATYAEGRWTRLYHPAIYDHAKAAGYIYEAHLRDGMTRRLGVRWQEVENGIAEIAGFTAEQLRAFSTRRSEILEAAGGEGASARAMQIATLTTRTAKDRDLTTESLRDLWRAKAQEIDLTREAIHSTFGREVHSADTGLTVAKVEAALTAHTSHFDRRDAIQAVADSLPAGAPGPKVVELADAYLSRPEVIPIAETAKGQRFTTRVIWELEQQALASAEAMAARSDRAVVDELVVSSTLSQRPSIKSDQEAMVRHLLRGGEGIVVVIGEAGTGKTYATVAAARGWAEGGNELRVAAPTWRAANVLRSEGLKAASVARLLAELDRGAAAGQQALARGSVLVVDEAGMVDSRAMARLIDHAQEAEAKLVLIGDPAQLGEIEAGGLFAAIASRAEAVVLDEVIRHRGELEREGAKLIRQGEGREALALYQGAERVTVSDDPLARREAMAADWWRSYREGEDAMMLAKRNAEVRELNEMAREKMRAEAKLGAEELQVGEARFAVGDQVITRINDQRLQVFNRERWRIAEVDAGSRRLVLDGIDTLRRVCVDSVFLGRVNPRDGAPAIEHAYAATIYQAQGATLDSAFVMADPSMTREEFYVATSRTRGETFLYVTPEVQLAREEIAPGSPYLRDGLEHIAEAAERSGAQSAAIDEALRSRVSQMPSDQLVSQLRELSSEIRAESQHQQAHLRHAERVAEYEQRFELLAGRREKISEPGRWERRADRAEREAAERDRAHRERWAREEAEKLRAEARELPEVRHEARAEAAVIESVLADRERLAAAAARVSPPDYIKRELGERPSDPGKAREWDKAVRGIEGYRERNGVVDRDSALGAKPKNPGRRSEGEQVKRQIERAQRALRLRQRLARARQHSHDMGRSLGR
ncbi:MAG: MobF family relaxase, partial [Solirubrobacterales bacterium]